MNKIIVKIKKFCLKCLLFIVCNYKSITLKIIVNFDKNWLSLVIKDFNTAEILRC